MATDNPQDRAANVISPQGGSISLDQLVSATSSSVLRVLKEHENQQSPIKFNPKIWVGIWVDLDRFNVGQFGGAGGGLRGDQGGGS